MSSRLHPEEDPEKAELLMDPELGTAAASSSTSSSRRQSSHSPSAAAAAAANPDFMLIKIVARIALSLIRRYPNIFKYFISSHKT